MTAPTLALLALACAKTPAVDGSGDVQAGTDFSLVDLNPTSPRSGEAISPRDYLQQVSGWYFIHST